MGKSTTTKQTNAPPKWAQPLFETSANDAMSLYKSGAGFQPYTGQRVAGMDQATQRGISQIGSLGGPGLGGMSVSNVTGTNQLNHMANGDYVKNGNPYYKQLLSGAVNDQTDQIKSMFSGSGRYGSGANQAVVGREAGNMMLQGLNDNYQFERGQMMDAGNILAGRKVTDFNNRLAAGNAGIQAGNLAQFNQQKLLDDKRNLFNEKQNVGWTRLGGLQAAAQGAAGAYGTQTQTQKQPFNPLALIGALGSMFPPTAPFAAGIY